MRFSATTAFTVLLLAVSALAAACSGQATPPNDAGADVVVTDTTVADVAAEQVGHDVANIDAIVSADVPDADTGPFIPPHTPENHRPNDVACSSAPAAGNCLAGSAGSCHQDSDCTGGLNPRCIEHTTPTPECVCTHDACSHDTDCRALGGPCACHGSAYVGASGNTCVAGDCQVDSDCPGGEYCSPSLSNASCGALLGYYCHTINDECTDDADCTLVGTVMPFFCGYVAASQRWECIQAHVCM